MYYIIYIYIIKRVNEKVRFSQRENSNLYKMNVNNDLPVI